MASRSTARCAISCWCAPINGEGHLRRRQSRPLGVPLPQPLSHGSRHVRDGRLSGIQLSGQDGFVLPAHYDRRHRTSHHRRGRASQNRAGRRHGDRGCAQACAALFTAAADVARRGRRPAGGQGRRETRHRPCRRVAAPSCLLPGRFHDGRQQGRVQSPAGRRPARHRRKRRAPRVAPAPRMCDTPVPATRATSSPCTPIC